MFGLFRKQKKNVSDGFEMAAYNSCINIEERFYIHVLNCLLDSKDLRMQGSFYDISTVDSLLQILYRAIVEEKFTESMVESYHSFSTIIKKDRKICRENVEAFLNSLYEYCGGIELMTIKDIKNKNRKVVLKSIGSFIEKALNKAIQNHHTIIEDDEIFRLIRRVRRGSITRRKDGSLAKTIRKYLKEIDEVERHVFSMRIMAITDEEKKKAKIIKKIFINMILTLNSKDNEDSSTIEERIKVECYERLRTVYKYFGLFIKNGDNYFFLKKTEDSNEVLAPIKVTFDHTLLYKKRKMFREIIRLVDQ